MGAAEAHETDDAFTSEQSYAATAEKSRELSEKTQARVLVAEADNAGQYCLLQDESVRGGEEALNTLEGSSRDSPVHMPSIAGVTALVEACIRKELSKREFSQEERENRKRGRADKQ